MVAFVPQWHTEAMFRRLLEDYAIHVELSSELVDFVDEGQRVVATVRRPDGSTETIRAGFLAGCDGSGSMVRKKLGIEFAGKSIKAADWMVGDVEVDGLEPDLMLGWARP